MMIVFHNILVQVDELWLLPSALTRQDVRDLMLHPTRHHNLIPRDSQTSREGGREALDVLTDHRDEGLDVGSSQLWSHGMEDPSLGHGGFELHAPNGSSCVKVPPYFIEESEGHLGSGRCSDDCDCCGARTCSLHGFCDGDPQAQILKIKNTVTARSKYFRVLTLRIAASSPNTQTALQHPSLPGHLPPYPLLPMPLPMF